MKRRTAATAILHRFLTMLIGLLCATYGMAAAVPVSDSDSLNIPAGYPFIIIPADSTVEVRQLPDSLFDRLSTNIIFRVNRFDIDPANPFLNTYRQTYLPYITANRLVLDKLFVRGGASPEGPYYNNRMLATRRAQAIIDLLQSADSIRRPIEIDTTPEDYRYLLVLLREAGDPAYPTVLELWQRHAGDDQALKRALMANRPLWQHLLRDYFPTLRAARAVFLFRKTQPEWPFAEIPDTLAQRPVTLEPFPLMTFTPLKLWQPTGAKAVRDRHEKIPRREFLSVKTNLLMDFAYMPDGYDRFCPMPNVAIEYYPRLGHFTYGASFDCPWWQDYEAHKYFQVRNYQFFTRYYFRSGSLWRNPPGRGAAFRGWYVSAYVHNAIYSICMDANHGVEGEGLGAGLGLGYVVGLGKRQHWRLEFGAQFGYFYTKYDPYQWLCPVRPATDPLLYYYKWYGEAEDFRTRQYRYTWLGPTRAEITLSYDLLYRRVKKKGISLKSHEYR